MKNLNRLAWGLGVEEMTPKKKVLTYEERDHHAIISLRHRADIG